MSYLSDPCDQGFVVTPNDAVDLASPSRAIYVAVAGAMKVTLNQGDTLVFPAMNAGAIYPLRASRIWSTGTTATGIIALH